MTKMPKFSPRWLVVGAAATWAAITAGAMPATTPTVLPPPPINRAIIDGRHIQPRADEFSQPGRTDISPSDARILEELYRKETDPRRFMPAD